MNWKTLLAYVSSGTQFPTQPWATYSNGMGSHLHLIHDRDGKYSPAFRRMVEHVGIKPLRLPARSPNLNSPAERWVLSVKSECLDHLIVFGERSLGRALRETLPKKAT